MTEIIRTTHIRTASESIEETVLVNEGQDSTLRSRIHRKQIESYSTMEVRSEDNPPSYKVLTTSN